MEALSIKNVTLLAGYALLCFLGGSHSHLPFLALKSHTYRTAIGDPDVNLFLRAVRRMWDSGAAPIVYPASKSGRYHPGENNVCLLHADLPSLTETVSNFIQC